MEPSARHAEHFDFSESRGLSLGLVHVVEVAVEFGQPSVDIFG